MEDRGSRRDVTRALSSAVEKRLANSPGIFAPEVEVPGGRVDYVAFHPFRPMGMNDICAATVEHGIFACYEVKSCMEDFMSGHGLNFVGDENWLVCPRELAKDLMGRSIGYGILVPNKAGNLVPYIGQPYGEYRKLPASEFLWRIVRASYGVGVGQCL